MLRLALIGRHDAHARYRRIALRIRGLQIPAVIDVPESDDGHKGPAAEIGFQVLDRLLTEQSADIDAILFHSPGIFSERAFLRAAHAGKHVFFDCPWSFSTSIVRDTVDACRKANVTLMAGPSHRFSPAIRTVQDNVAAGRLGAPGLLRIHRWAPHASEPPSPSAATMSAHLQPLLEQLIDEIDVACWLFGRQPAVAFAVSTPCTAGPRGKSVESGEYLQVHLGFSEGGMALIDLANTLPAGAPYYSLSLIGSTGAAYADDHHNMQLLFGGGAPAALAANACDVVTVGRLQEFVDAIEGCREPSVATNEILRACSIAEAAMLAASTGRAVPIPEVP